MIIVETLMDEYAYPWQADWYRSQVKKVLGARAQVAVGKPVTFSGSVEVPPNTGTVVSAEWDFEGAGDYPVEGQISASGTGATVTASYAFSKPGTYFPALRVASQRQGNSTSPFARALNLGRVRVVVA